MGAWNRTDDASPDRANGRLRRWRYRLTRAREQFLLSWADYSLAQRVKGIGLSGAVAAIAIVVIVGGRGPSGAIIIAQDSARSESSAEASPEETAPPATVQLDGETLAVEEIDSTALSDEELIEILHQMNAAALAEVMGATEERTDSGTETTTRDGNTTTAKKAKQPSRADLEALFAAMQREAAAATAPAPAPTASATRAPATTRPPRATTTDEPTTTKPPKTTTTDETTTTKPPKTTTTEAPTTTKPPKTTTTEAPTTTRPPRTTTEAPTTQPPTTEPPTTQRPTTQPPTTEPPEGPGEPGPED